MIGYHPAAIFLPPGLRSFPLLDLPDTSDSNSLAGDMDILEDKDLLDEIGEQDPMEGQPSAPPAGPSSPGHGQKSRALRSRCHA